MQVKVFTRVFTQYGHRVTVRVSVSVKIRVRFRFIYVGDPTSLLRYPKPMPKIVTSTSKITNNLASYCEVLPN